MKNKTEIKGGAALDALFKMLFKGIDNIMGYAAEYENDMGVLKQVTRIPVKDIKGKEHELVIKLAPVKDRDGIYYVEVSCEGYDDFNATEFNKKTMQLDNKKQSEFEDKILKKLLEQNKLVVTDGDERSSDNKDSTSDSIECYKESKFEEWAESEYKGQEPKIIVVNVMKTPSSSKGKFDLQFSCEDVELRLNGIPLNEDNTSNIDKSQIDKFVTEVIEDSGLITVKKATDMKEDFENPESENSQDYLNDMEQGTPAASYVDVSLSYIKSSDEINLSAIYANYDVAQAMNALQQVIDNDEFVETLTEEPQSFRITDEGDDYDVTLIDVVDTSNAANDIYTSICALSGLIDAYSVNLDPQQQAAMDELANALAKAQSVFQPTDQLDPL